MRWIITGMILLGSLLMVYNICGFTRFARRVSSMKSWQSSSLLLNVPIVLLIFFLLGYLIVGFFGSPDIVMAGILFFGSVFVYIMYRLISTVTDRILENEKIASRLLAAEEASSAKTAFLASMSHEMRTPLNVILGTAELACKEPDLPGKAREQFEKIGQSGRQLLELISHILTLNNYDSGELVLRCRPLSPAELLAQVSATAQALCASKGLAYRYEPAQQLPACCECDEAQLRRLLLALLDNAVKYTDAPGSVTFAVACVEDEGHAALTFTVADTGIGMSKEFLERVFEPFTQEDASFTNRYGGGGLSLAVAKKLAELMGGSIEVQSEKGKGSSFTLHVSLAVPEAEADESVPGNEVSLADCRILVVEDVAENAEIVQDLLELEGAESERAENGQIALELFERAPAGTYDAILMDLRMPVMDGLEATRRIRALPRADAASVPIIALTANAFEGDVEASLGAGMNAHLAKPADAELLYDTIRKWISICHNQKGGAHD